MSIIETFYNATATNTRRTTATATTSDAITTVSSAIPGVLRPITDTAKLYIENNIGKEYDWVTDEAWDIKVGDDLHIGGVKYDVLGVSEFEDLEDDTETYKNIRVSK